MPSRSAAALLIAGALLALGSGCGAGPSFTNNPRPPSPITVSAAITRSGITVSPPRFGAGIVQFVIPNLTSATQTLTVQAPGHAAAGRTGAIAATDTADLKLDLAPGSYTLSVGDSSVASATLQVGAPRASSQNELLQP